MISLWGRLWLSLSNNNKGMSLWTVKISRDSQSDLRESLVRKSESSLFTVHSPFGESQLTYATRSSPGNMSVAVIFIYALVTLAALSVGIFTTDWCVFFSFFLEAVCEIYVRFVLFVSGGCTEHVRPQRTSCEEI
jgi:hypothetical protein